MSKERLYSPKVIKQLLDFFEFKFSKGLGQNFLIDGNVVRSISQGSGITKEENVLEIGPGFGTLTEELCMNAKKVVAVEIDERLNIVLDQTLREFDNFKLINADILKVDLKKLTQEEFGNEEFKVVANLPYYITTPIISRFLEEELNVSSMTFMVQKEVADRILAKPGNKQYGSLTVFVNFYANAQMVVKAPKSVFIPQPKIDSVVVKLEMKKELSKCNKELFFKIVHSGFMQRRKNILNSFTSNNSFGLTKEVLGKVLDELEISTNSRAEDLSLENYLEIINKLDKILN